MKRMKFKAIILAAMLVTTMTFSSMAAAVYAGDTSANSAASLTNTDGTTPPAPPVNADGSTTPPDLPTEENGSTPPTNADGSTTPPEKPSGEEGNQPGGQGGASDIEYTAVKSYTKDSTLANTAVSSTEKDESAILVDGGKVNILKATISRNSSDSTGGDNSSFYGVGAAVLTKSGASYISKSTITTDSAGGAGVFSYKDGTTYIANSTITTKEGTSGGIHAAGGGKLYAWNLDVTTNGSSSAAIRSDRGGGTMRVDGGSYTSNGTGSPAVYSTADIAVNNASLEATNSEAVCIEGLNSLRIFDSTLTGNMPDDSQNETKWNIILYQSMSGDSEIGCSTFEMVGGTINAKAGGVFYTTNTESKFIIDNVDINKSDADEYILRCTGNINRRGWGTSGKNGALCNFTGISQELEGNVVWDSISNLDMYLTNGSELTGAVIDDESCAGEGGSGYANLYIDKDSAWVVTGNSAVTNLYNAGTIKDDSGNSVTIKDAAGQTLAAGNSAYTITVNTYSTNADMSGASSSDTYSVYKVTKPSVLSAAATLSKATISKTASTSKNKLTLNWKKVSNASGYIIQVSTSSKFTSETTTKYTVKSGATLKKTISSLKSGKKYYVRIKAYRTLNGSNLYSSWSKTGSVKVK